MSTWAAPPTIDQAIGLPKIFNAYMLIKVMRDYTDHENSPKGFLNAALNAVDQQLSANGIINDNEPEDENYEVTEKSLRARLVAQKDSLYKNAKKDNEQGKGQEEKAIVRKQLYQRLEYTRLLLDYVKANGSLDVPKKQELFGIIKNQLASHRREYQESLSSSSSSAPSLTNSQE